MYGKINDCINVHIYTSRNYVYSLLVNFLFVVSSSFFRFSKEQSVKIITVHPSNHFLLT